MKHKALVKDDLPKLLRSMADLVKQQVMVGVPADNADRTPDAAGIRPAMNNAALAYIHDHGAPEANIPARPFMRPGIESAQDGIEKGLKVAATGALDGDDATVNRGLHTAGMRAQAGIKGHITEGIDPALAPSTVAARRRSRQTASTRKAETDYAGHVAAGMAPGEAQTAAGITPLVNTGALRNSITYTIRKK